MMSLLTVEHLAKTYQSRLGTQKVTALKDINFEVEKGEYVAIMGESGSGKSTLLNILATLDRPTTGHVYLDGQDIEAIKPKERTRFRREQLGFVFQQFNLLPTLTVEDNIALPLVLAKRPANEILKHVRISAQKLGIANFLKQYPYEISGGQQQRVAVARSLITNPSLILADEPTGALDSKSSMTLLQLFSDLHKNGQTIVMVTHSTEAASYANRVLFIKDGAIYHQLYQGDDKQPVFYQKITQTLSVMAGGAAHVL